MDYFLHNILMPETNNDEDIREKCQAMEILNAKGLFSRVLLRELQELGRKLYPKTPNGSTYAESAEVIDFLTQIANKPPEEEVELTFRRSNIRIGFILVARMEVISTLGYSPYLKRIESHRNQGTETIYISGLGDNVPYTKKVAQLAEEQKFGRIVSSDEFKIKGRTRPVPAVCITFST